MGEKGSKGDRSGGTAEGLIQVYTGNGKGKTTAALGQALRASGHGFRVVMLQFLKGGYGYGEHSFVKRYHPFEIVQVAGKSCFDQSREERQEDAQKALWSARELVVSDDWDMVILDEVLTALSMGLLKTADVLDLMEAKQDATELILTGRGALPQVIQQADLVTEMLPVKHPYTEGTKGRKGIEF